MRTFLRRGRPRVACEYVCAPLCANMVRCSAFYYFQTIEYITDDFDLYFYLYKFHTDREFDHERLPICKAF